MEIDNKLLKQLMKIEPSTFLNMEYRPCKVYMKNGNIIRNAYICEAEMYLKTWGVWPEDDKEKSFISIQDVSDIEESELRIPARLANKMYKAGESGMGYCIFTLVLKDGRKLPCLTGNAVDFVDFPLEVNPDMIADLLPHQGRELFQKSNSGFYTQGAKYYWCLYSNPKNNEK
ncbi:MAG: hypothetical protein U0Z26_17930 [Anaerolineales bacterium]